MVIIALIISPYKLTVGKISDGQPTGWGIASGHKEEIDFGIHVGNLLKTPVETSYSVSRTVTNFGFFVSQIQKKKFTDFCEISNR